MKKTTELVSMSDALLACRKASVWFCALAMAMFVLSPKANAQNLIQNGSFQTGDFTGWTTGANSFPEYIVGAPVAPGDTYSAQIAGYSYNPDTLSQTVTTTSSSDFYNLSFSWFIGDGGNTTLLNVYWDGSSVFSQLDTGPFNTWLTFSTVVRGTGDDTLLFSCANDPSETYLDDVSLTYSSSVSVPDQGSLFLVTCGSVLGMFAVRRRMTAQA